jgi:hypothetical protein
VQVFLISYYFSLPPSLRRRPHPPTLSWFLSPPWHLSSLFLYIYDFFFVIYQVNFFKREDQRATTVLHDGTNEAGRTVIRTQCAVMELTKFRFEPCGCSYDDHWRLTWSLTSGPVGLVEIRASWSGHPH